MTQAIEARKERGEHNNEPAEYGILEEVTVKNFMCHGHFTFKLGPLINFICGKNGSGKSAILTAIILCLGGKASATNRGARLQNFIKEGADFATILCKIKNQGENAYLPDLYGETIQVERNIQRGGSSGFKIKSEKGRVISTRKSDLEEICDHMMLQIENPLAVLSQDQARQFIAGSSAAEKYKFFMKGVQLEQLDQDYRLIEEQLDNISARIGEREPDLKQLKDKNERAVNKLALSDKYDDMREKLRDYRRQIAWCQVAAKEGIRDEYAETLREAGRKIAAVRVEAEKLDVTFEKSDQAAITAKERFDVAQAEVTRVKDEQTELKTELNNTKKTLNDALTEQRQIQELLKHVNQTISKWEKDIATEEQRLAELDGGGAARRIAERDVAKEEVVTSKQDEQHHTEQRQVLQEELIRMQNLVNETTEARKREGERVTELERHIKNLKESSDTQDSAFHRNMGALLKAIHHETGFQERPIGPLGKHVKLLAPEWSAILETVFGKSLAGFIVTSKRDENLLRGILRRTQCGDLPVFIANNMPMDIDSHLPDAGFRTILGVLEIDNELVKKQLVIAHHIDQAILHADLFEATDIFRNNGTPLRNVKRCYCLGQKEKDRGFVLSYRQGKVAQDPTHGWRGLPRMKTDIAENIRLQEQALGDRKAQRLRADQEFQSAQNRLVRSGQSLKAHGRQARDFRIKVQEAENRVEVLEDAIKEDSVESGKLEQLREAMQKSIDEKAVHENSYGDSVNNRDEKKRLLDAARTKCNTADKVVEEAEAIANKAKSAAQGASQKRSVDLGEKNNAYARITDAEKDQASMQERMQAIEESVVDITEQARQISERVNVPRGENYETLKRKFEKLGSEVKKWSQQVGDRAELSANASKCATAYKTAQEEIQQLKSLQKQLTRTLTTRKSRWARFRMFITARSRAGFTLKLGERGFRGKLQIDHKKKEMDIAVEPDITRRDGKGRSAKTLSGGEKSFSQICLLLSIWDAMGVPIRCLDEFDVYMDAVNRNTSVRLLIDGARHSAGGQFVLISPGVRSDIPKDADVNTVQ